MKTWIVTGGAASGKSSFCQICKDSGVHVEVFSSDATVHLAYEDSAVAAEIREKLGLEPEGDVGKPIDRKVLGKRIFADSQARKTLESILHPYVRAEYAKLRQKLEDEGKTQFLIAEVPLFYESGGEFPADQVILVAVSPELQLQRIVEGRGLTPAEANRILDAQLPLESKIARADKVVWNEGDPLMLHQQAELLLSQEL